MRGALCNRLRRATGERDGLRARLRRPGKGAVRVNPILVDRLSAEQAKRLRCEKCRHEANLNLPDDLNQEATWECPACGEWAMHFKYEEADRCPNCDKLGFWDERLRRCCSRVCLLQVEYAEALAV